MDILKNKKEQVQSVYRWKQKANRFFITYYRWLVLAIFISIVGGGYIFIIKPGYNLVTIEMKAENEQLRSDFLDKEREYLKLKKLIKNYEQIKQEDKDKIEAMVPTAIEMEKLISDLEIIAIKNGISLASINIMPMENKEWLIFPAPSGSPTANDIKEIPAGVSQVKISLSLDDTDYNGIKNILRTIENNLRLMDVTNVQFGSGGEKLNLELITYYLK